MYTDADGEESMPLPNARPSRRQIVKDEKKEKDRREELLRGKNFLRLRSTLQLPQEASPQRQSNTTQQQNPLLLPSKKGHVRRCTEKSH